MFISVNVEQEAREAEIAALDALRAELEAKGVAVKEGWWVSDATLNATGGDLRQIQCDGLSGSIAKFA